jgi:hypothetical protein
MMEPEAFLGLARLLGNRFASRQTLRSPLKLTRAR